MQLRIKKMCASKNGTCATVRHSRSFVFSQSSCEVSASFTDVGGVAVGAIDLIYCSLSVPRFVSVFDVSQLLT